MQANDEKPLRLACEAMGTRFELVLSGGAERQLRAIGEEALGEIAGAERRLSAFRRDSVVSMLNREAGHRACRVDDELFALLECCREVHAASGGAFDPTLGALMRHWGHRGRAPGPAPELGALRARAGMQRVELDAARRTVRFEAPGLELDLGAVGKGHAVDLALEVLRDHGVPRALLHGGTSTVATIGRPRPETGWIVALQHPRTGHPSPASAVLEDGCLSVSAPHGRQSTGRGEALGHVLDPRTGCPARGALLCAVLSDSATLADAWSTALLVRACAGDLEEAALPDTISVLWLTDGPGSEALTRGPRARDFALGESALPPTAEKTRDDG